MSPRGPAEGAFHMSCVMRCPACMEEVKREKWSKAQWKNSDPWREGRKCCTVCQKTDTDGRNTWHTDGKLHMRQDEYRAYARVLREGWEQPQQRSRESKSKQFCVESRRNPGCVPAAAYASVVVHALAYLQRFKGIRESRRENNGSVWLPERRDGSGRVRCRRVRREGSRGKREKR